MAPGIGIEPMTNRLTVYCTTAVLPWNFGGALGSRTLSAARHHRGISNPVPYHPAHVPCYYYIVNEIIRQQLFGGESGIRTPYTVRWKIYSLLKSPMLLTLHTWWTVPGSNRGLRLAKPLCSQLYQQPMIWRLVMESNHR